MSISRRGEDCVDDRLEMKIVSRLGKCSGIFARLSSEKNYFEKKINIFEIGLLCIGKMYVGK